MSQTDEHATFKTGTPLSAGKLLQTARAAHDLTLADVASKLRISEQYVKDLEADDYTHIGARAYVRGYMLSYAKLVGIHQNDMLSAMQTSLIPEENMSMQKMLNREKPKINISLHPRGRYKRHLSRWFGGAIVVILIVLVVFWWQSQKAPITPVELNKTAPTLHNSPPAADPSQQTSDNANQDNELNLPINSPAASLPPLATPLLPANGGANSNTGLNQTGDTSLSSPTSTQPSAVSAQTSTHSSSTAQRQSSPASSQRNATVKAKPASVQRTNSAPAHILHQLPMPGAT